MLKNLVRSRPSLEPETLRRTPLARVVGVFLCAKSASAATAALDFAGYTLAAFDVAGHWARVAVGVALVALLTGVLAGGMQRSNRANERRGSPRRAVMPPASASPA